MSDTEALNPLALYDMVKEREAEIERLGAEIEAAKATFDDEEAAHTETLAEVERLKAQVALLSAFESEQFKDWCRVSERAAEADAEVARMNAEILESDKTEQLLRDEVARLKKELEATRVAMARYQGLYAMRWGQLERSQARERAMRSALEWVKAVSGSLVIESRCDDALAADGVPKRSAAWAPGKINPGFPHGPTDEQERDAIGLARDEMDWKP